MRASVVAALVSVVASPMVGMGAAPASKSKSSSSSSSASTAAEGRPGGRTFAIGTGKLRIGVCDANIIRVSYAPTTTSSDFFARVSLATAVAKCPATPFSVTEDKRKGRATITTSRLSVGIDTRGGVVEFRDLEGRTILRERADGRTLVPVEVQGEQTFHVRQQWESSPDESLYGLGQHQQGLMDLRGFDLDLRQYNTEIFIPFLVSSRGYGLLWDNTSFTRFGDLTEAVPLPGAVGLYASGANDGATGTGTTLAGDVAGLERGHVEWSGTVVAPVTGDYQIRTYSAGGIQVRVGDAWVIDHWRQGWLPNEDLARVHLTAGQTVPVELRWTRDIGVNILRLLWKPPVAAAPTAPATALWSEVGEGVDYTFVYGPALDQVVAGYRQLTGVAPLPPRWAFGLWQCRERYATQKESLEVLAGFRTRGIPVDNIVQDWRYWPEGTWGSHTFDPRRFPDPTGWIAEIHDRFHAHLMISVWPKFYRGTANFEALAAAGFLYRPNLLEGRLDFLRQAFTYYDAFSPAARRLYWSQIDRELFSRKVDAWWMDATEPEVVEGPFKSVAAQVEANRTHMHPTAAGTGARMLNAYALVNSEAVYEGQRAAAPDRRVFILTRNGFAGQQRYGAASWSGDISSTWTALRRQIPAGLGFSLSGMPYWTLDAGGFSVPPRFASPARGSPELEEWRELNTRWFELAAFLPLLRVHGQAPKREMWEFGGDGSPALEAQKKFDRLRYRLLPYIYSLAGAVTHQGGTILRPLVMDFPADPQARRTADQFLFGPALLVSPVTTYRARARTVYLPATAGGWYDLWTGTPAGKAGPSGGPEWTEVRAPFDEIPVQVRAGSILAFGPELQYTDEKPADPITLVIYAGADGAFTLYEDEGLGNDYERGAFTRIDLRWSEATRTLALGARQGAFPQMLGRRTFQLVVVTPTKRAPFSFSFKPDQTVVYSGAALSVRFP